MMVEIRKTNFVNKGAELMLHAILQEVGKRYPDAEFAMLPEKNAPFKERARLGLYQKLKLRQQGSLQDILGGLISKKIRDRYGIVLDKEIDVVLDAAGFAYSDQWGDRIAQDTAQSVQKWKKQGTKVIFMPQAFGPFKSPKIQEAMKIIVDNADLVYARERISYEHLTGVVGKRDNIRLAPDFTNLIQGELPKDFDKENNRFCLVPNARMLDKTSPQEAAAYPAFMARCARLLHDAGAKPFILIHEGQKDQDLALKIIEPAARDL